MHQPIDEFAMPDIRHFLAEAWRMIRHRRWYFVFAFLIAGTLAFSASFLVPRKYSATTILKRESDPALASMMGKDWTQRYAEIRQRMAGDLGDVQAIAAVLKDLHVSVNGSESAPSFEHEAQKIAEGLNIKSVESSNNRDVVSLSLTLPNPCKLAPILQGIRDRYVGKTKSETVEILRGLEQFFLIQVEKSRQDLDKIRRELSGLEARYPGVNPENGDPSQMERTTLAIDRLEAERQQSALKEQRRLLAREVDQLEKTESGGAMDGSNVRAGAFRELAIDSSMNPPPAQAPNPRYAELQAQKEKLAADIAANKSLKAMTDQHPEIVRLRAALESMEQEIFKTPESLPSEAIAPTKADRHDEGTRLRKQIAEIDVKITLNESKLEETRNATARVERNRLSAAANRDNYLKLRQKAERMEADLNSWQQNIAPIRRLLTLEDSNRSMHFTTLREIEASAAPVFPAAWMVLAVCLGIGVAAGASCVAVAEFLDRSYRTAKQLASLGVPVIRTIDEILTGEARRNRFLRRLVLVPSLATILLAALITAGSLAYFSLGAGPGTPGDLQIADAKSSSAFETTDGMEEMGD